MLVHNSQSQINFQHVLAIVKQGMRQEHRMCKPFTDQLIGCQFELRLTQNTVCDNYYKSNTMHVKLIVVFGPVGAVIAIIVQSDPHTHIAPYGSNQLNANWLMCQLFILNNCHSCCSLARSRDDIELYMIVSYVIQSGFTKHVSGYQYLLTCIGNHTHLSAIQE